MRVVDKRKKGEAITRAAIREFAARGYERSSISSIAAAADMATGGVYNYFKNKESLFVSCCKQIHAEFMDGMEKALNESDPIFGIIKHALLFFGKNVDYARLTFMEARNFFIRFPQSEVGEIWYSQIDNFLYDRLKAFLPETSLIDPRLYLSIMLGGVEHIIMLAILKGYFGELDIDETAKKVAAIVLRRDLSE